MLRALAVVLTFGLMASHAQAQDNIVPITEGFQQIGPNVEGQPEAGFIIYGPSARQMYQMMRSPEQHDHCTEGKVKMDPSGFNCGIDPSGEATCSFGYNFANQSVTAGPLTC